MTITIRPAGLHDIGQISDLLLTDAEMRCASEPGLWRLDAAPQKKIGSTVKASMEAEKPAFREQWLIAESSGNGNAVGVTHSILLPIPPIYAGELGPPGLIMEDCFVQSDAPPEARTMLLHAAEAELVKVGARLLLASGVAGGDWESEYLQQGFEPLTLYFAKTGLSETRAFNHVRSATADDVPDIVALSAVNRRTLKGLQPIFWKPHEDADSRFGSWMKHSLTFSDRDMFVSERDGKIQGYAISQPATPLHFPSPHDISAIGVIDDYFHEGLGNAEGQSSASDKAVALLEAAEAARARRGNTSVLVVCPASWHSKITLLERSGYRKAITWFMKIRG